MVARSSYRTGYEPEVNVGSIKEDSLERRKIILSTFMYFVMVMTLIFMSCIIVSLIVDARKANNDIDTADTKFNRDGYDPIKAFNDLDKVKVIEFKESQKDRPKEISEARYNDIYTWVALDKWYAKTVKPMMDNDGIIDEDELLLINQAWDYECIKRKEQRIDALREKLNTEIEKQLNKDDIIKGN